MVPEKSPGSRINHREKNPIDSKLHSYKWSKT